jgi:hypothetical protein
LGKLRRAEQDPGKIKVCFCFAFARGSAKGCGPNKKSGADPEQMQTSLLRCKKGLRRFEAQSRTMEKG